MEEHYVGAAGSWCLLYEPGKSGRWKNIMLVLQVPGVYYMNPERSEWLKNIMLIATDSLHLLLWTREIQSDGGTLCWCIRSLHLLLWIQGNESDEAPLCWLLWVHHITSYCLFSLNPPLCFCPPVPLPGLPPIRAADLGRRDTLDNATSLFTAHTTR